MARNTLAVLAIGAALGAVAIHALRSPVSAQSPDRPGAAKPPAAAPPGAGPIYATAFGTVCDGVTDDRAHILAALNAADRQGGGEVVLPRGACQLSDTLEIGNGTENAQSTIHNRIILVGQGMGSAPDVSNTEAAAPTRLVYAGPASPAKAVVEIDGPIHNLYLRDMALDASRRAGIGLKIIHLNDWSFERIEVENFTTNSYVFTSRSRFVTGVAYGMSNGSCYDCYAYSPASNRTNGVLMTSGVSPEHTLVGAPDTASIRFYGGVLLYGGSTGSYGLKLDGADNNIVEGTQLIPRSDSDHRGESVVMARWPGSPQWPLENLFLKLGLSQSPGGTGGLGGNRFEAFATSDGAAFPTTAGVSGDTIAGLQYADGRRLYRVSDTAKAELNNRLENVAGRSPANFAGLVVQTAPHPAKVKLVITFTGMLTKEKSGFGVLYLAVDGMAHAPTQQEVQAVGRYQNVAMSYSVDVPAAGSNTVSLQGASSDGEKVDALFGVLQVQTLF